MKIAIYGTSDMHGYVYPTNYVEDKKLGILKVGSYILKDEKNYDRSVKVDCGDLIQGSPFTQYLSKHEFESNPVTDIMRKIGYDIYTFGNHEFNYGLQYLEKSYKPLEGKIINANIKGLPLKSEPYKILDTDGFKIGFIGLTTSYIPNWEAKDNIRGLEFLNPVEAYGRYEAELKEKCDFIAVCYHGGFERSLDDSMKPTEPLTGENMGSELLKKYDSIDVILSGHQHRSFAVKVNGVVCTQPLNNAVNFAKVVIDTETKEVEYELIDVESHDVSIEPSLEAIASDTEKKLHEYLNIKIGHFEKDILLKDLFEARLYGHPFVNFLNEVQLEASGADISAVSIFDTAIGFKKDVTIKDVIINYPFANTLKVIKISGRKLKEAIEKSVTYFHYDDGIVGISHDFLYPKKQNYNYDMFGGMEYTVDLNRPYYDRVISMRRDGCDMDLDKEYTLVLSSYRASNVSVYPAYEGAEVVREIDIDISELITDYIGKHPVLKADDKKYYEIKY